MSFKEQVAHTTAVAKWKADQQFRLFKIQNQIRDIENQIKPQKALLADTALNLYNQHRLIEAELMQICNTISQLDEQIKEQQNIQEMIKGEHAPEFIAYSSSVPPSNPPSYSTDDVPSVPQSNPPSLLTDDMPDVPPSDPLSLSTDDLPAFPPSYVNNPSEVASLGLVCPNCNRSLSGRFCPDHGLEGVPAKQNQEA
jgi:hypothetical protein